MGLGALLKTEHLDGMPAADCGWSPGLGLYLGVRPSFPCCQRSDPVPAASLSRLRPARPAHLPLRPGSSPSALTSDLRHLLSTQRPGRRLPRWMLFLDTRSPCPHALWGLSVTATLINGDVPGLLRVTRVFPVDLAEARLQNQRGQEIYKGIGLPGKTARGEGFLGVNQGAAVNLTAVTPEKAIKLAASDFWQQLLEEDGVQHNLKLEMLAGCGAGLCQAVVTCPLEMLKIQLQRAGRLGARPRPSSAKELLRTQDLVGLYWGLAAALLR
ncbi:PREDICTED: mitochondrial glutamate carrier 2 [Lipotes vexillifer]|uniref:Mitochondrial glutamate carrier 2 n=1 Tax=Lipotes vexillifer TaxID=118797 RepID=A0A340Y7F2_LIPVE|nr:PREDICTED: mitochondrial glutamate carrier 2 [Lipotes vexillifer]